MEIYYDCSIKVYTEYIFLHIEILFCINLLITFNNLVSYFTGTTSETYYHVKTTSGCIMWNFVVFLFKLL